MCVASILDEDCACRPNEDTTSEIVEIVHDIFLSESESASD